jgi:hypothetical protein
MMQFPHVTPRRRPGFEDIGARRLMAIHWGTFNLASGAAAEPPVRTEAEGRRSARSRPDLIFHHGETRRW